MQQVVHHPDPSSVQRQNPDPYMFYRVMEPPPSVIVDSMADNQVNTGENIWRYLKILSDPGRGVDHLKAAADVGVACCGRVAAAAGEGGSEDQPGGALPDPHDAAPQHRQRHVLPQAVLRLRGRASNNPSQRFQNHSWLEAKHNQILTHYK